MKRLTIVLTLLVALCGVATAQLQSAPDVKGLEKKIRKSNEDIANPKKMEKVSTWHKRADLMMEVANAERMNCFPGMDAQLFRLQMGSPVEQREQTIGETNYAVQVMPRAEFYFANSALALYKVTTPIEPSALDKALEAFEKALTLEQKPRGKKDLYEGMNKLRSQYIQDAVNFYGLQEYKSAIQHFKKAIHISETPGIDIVDTLVYYNMGLASFLDKQYDEAVAAFRKAADLGYTMGGAIYCTCYEAAAAAGKKDEGKEILTSAIEKYPEQKCLALNLINYYLEKGEQPTNVLPYLDKAIQNDPNNATLYFVKGVVYNNLEDFDQAEAAYRKAVELDPKYVDAYYNRAAMYYNQAVSLTNKALELPASQQAEYEAMEKQINELFHKCIEPCEKALELDANHAPSLDLLKSVYFRYRSEPGMSEKHEAIQKRIEALGSKPA